MGFRKLSCFAAVALVFAASACGDDDDDATAADETASTETSAPAATGAPSGEEDAEWQAIVDAANEEGEVTVYTTTSAGVEAALPVAFAEDYPDITLNYERISLADSEAKIEAELQGGLIADVVEVANPEYMQRMSDEGHVVAPVGPAFDDPAYPDRDEWPTDEAFPHQRAIYAWGWNTDLVPDGITSWDDFLDLDAGLLGMVDPSISSVIVDEYENIEELAGADYFDKLASADIDPQLYPGGNPAAAALAAGEIGAVLDLAVTQIAPLQAEGSPVDFSVYDGAWAPTVYSMILEDGPHPNAAQVYANWMVSEKAQQVQADNDLAPVLETVEYDAIPEGFTVNPTEPVTTEQAEAFMRRWGQLFG